MDSTTKQIVETLSEIETTAEEILSQAENQKPVIEAEYREKIKNFDADLEVRTQSELTKLHQEFEKSKEKLLNAQKENNESTISSLRSDFDKNHDKYARQILTQIIGADHV